MRRPLATAAAALTVLAVASGCQPASAPEAAVVVVAPPAFDAGIEAAHLTQAAQRLGGAVPLVAGRQALVRVFLRAGAPGLPAPEVRVLLVDTASDSALTTAVATSPLQSIPTALFEASRGGSWNALLDASDLEPGRHLVVEMDRVPGLALERQQLTLRVPATGSLDVRTPAPLRVTLVPIVQSGQVPDVVGTRSAASWLDLAQAAYPVPRAEVEVAPTLTTQVVLGGDGTGWSDLLDELEQKRLADGSTRHYLGVVHLSATTGTAGRALNGGRSLLVSDLPGFYQRIAAHELGHNLGLMHAPCGAAFSSVDPDWPAEEEYVDGRIGSVGWDPRSGAVKDPAVTYDLMSYCGGDETTWISDFGYQKVLAQLPVGAAVELAGGAADASSSAAAAGRQPCLLVTGRLDGGQAVLRSVEVVVTRPALLPDGPYRLDLLDAAGRPVASLPFAPHVSPAEVAGESPSLHFAMAVPLDAGLRAALAGVAVRRRGLAVEETLAEQRLPVTR